MMIHKRRHQAALILTLLLGSATSAPAQQVSNPQLFAKSLEAATEALTFYRRYENPAEERRVNDIGYRLVLHSRYEKYPFSFFLVDMPIPNAFALPGGHIFITRGMLDLGLTDDMLAGLLGHEIAHVTQGHFVQMRKRATLLNVLSQVLTLGVLVAANNQSDRRNDPNYGRYPYPEEDNGASLVQGAAAAGLVVSELLLRSYSRENEDESDEEGQRLAAAAGFDPAGTRQLMAKMKERLPQSRRYGYWQTHPFFEERVRAAEARGVYIKIQSGKPADEYRLRTQTALLGFLSEPKITPPMQATLKEAALVAWPQGPAAEEIRLEKLQAQREEEIDKTLLSRDYGRLREAYEEQLEIVQGLTPESSLIPKLRQELGELLEQMKESYPKAVEVLGGGVFETSFLETFLSNYPDATQVPQVALELGIAYSRLGRQTDSVEHFLKVWNLAPDGEASQRAQLGLRNLAPVLDQLGALQHLATQDEDLELKRLSSQRLEEQASLYEDVANGADYLRRFPDAIHASVVNDRLNQLAEVLFNEMLLYQKLGDSANALERINQILRHAPLSPAAERLSDRAILKGT